MDNNKYKYFGILIISVFNLACLASTYAATVVLTKHQPISILQSYLPITTSRQDDKKATLSEINRDLDANQTLHVRIEEKYSGYPVIGASAILHIPHTGDGKQTLSELISTADNTTSITGVLYQGLDNDLASQLTKIESLYQKRKANYDIWKKWRDGENNKQLFLDEDKFEIVVIIDKNHKANWAYKIQYMLNDGRTIFSRPIYIVNANTFEVYANWNSQGELTNPRIDGAAIKTYKAVLTHKLSDDNNLEDVRAGGFGGNQRTGQLIYDGLLYPSLSIKRNPSSATCYMSNAFVNVKNNYNDSLVDFSCEKLDPYHSGLYWDGSLGAISGGYSPANDSLYAGTVITQMFQKWYGISPLHNDDGTPRKIEINIHAYNDDMNGTSIYVGDRRYPSTTLSSIGYLFGFAFTTQHARMSFNNRYGTTEAESILFAFGSMTAEAVKYFSWHKNDWQIGADVNVSGEAEHSLDDPAKDCANGGVQGYQCHINSVTQFNDNMWPGYTCGPFEHAFYLLATTPGWNTKKAYDVMLKANENYWYPDVTFEDGACGVISAAKDDGYDTDAVRKAFNAVDVDTSGC